MATEGGDSPAVDSPDRPAGPNVADADVVITTVVSADEPKAAPPPEAPKVEGPGADMEWIWADRGEEADDLRPPMPPREAPAGPAAAPEPAANLSSIEERLAALEALPTTVEAMGKVVRHELQRCAGVLFAHDKALGAVAARLDGLEAAPKPAEPAEDAPPVEARVLAWVDDMSKRLVAMEARVEPLEPLPT
ncbi:MAG: hypothetical protein M3163_10350, partial [Actinomycetota bacterium]|nr:hypothetical protein [Actinomycetota bacterium]